MLDYLIVLMEDANDFSWDAARASHAVLLCRMEQGEVKGYSEIEKLDRIRRANAQRHVTTSPNESPKKLKSSKVLTCSYFNQDTCVHQRSHDTKGTMYRHICNYCFQQTGKTYHILNKIVGMKIPKRQCQKTNNLGWTKGCFHPKNSVASCI